MAALSLLKFHVGCLGFYSKHFSYNLYMYFKQNVEHSRLNLVVFLLNFFRVGMGSLRVD